MLMTAPAFADIAVCGNGIVEGSEECDDGGICIGGSNAGTACTAEGQCHGNGVCVGGSKEGVECASFADCDGSPCVHCRTFGGDGCATNCTPEMEVPFPFVPGIMEGLRVREGTSGAVAFGDILAIPLPFVGRMVLTIGAARGDGHIPLVIRADSFQIPQIPVETGLVCACVRGVALRTCGGVLFRVDGSLTRDCSYDPAVCPSGQPCAAVHGVGNTAAGSIDCGGPSVVDSCVSLSCGGGLIPFECGLFSGPDTEPPIPILALGAAQILLTTDISTRIGCAASFCTESHPLSERGLPLTAKFVTGQASAMVCNANEGGNSVGPIVVTGQPFDCAALARGSANGACLVGAATVVDQQLLGDIAIATRLYAAPLPTPTVTPKPGTCVGDCDGDGVVTVEEIIRLIAIALGIVAGDSCPGSAPCGGGDGGVFVDCILQAVNAALLNCPTPQRQCGGFAGLPCSAGEVCDIREQCEVADAAGLCTERPQACALNIAPVCGCDGVTYSNDCLRLRGGVSLAHDGACTTLTPRG
jgi:hypothetical protein